MGFLEIQQGLADAAATVTGLRTHPALPDTINPPTFAPADLAIDYDLTMAHSLDMTLYTCGLYVSRGDSDVGRKAMLPYLQQAGDKSIKAAIEADRTLGGTCKTLIVERVRGAYALYPIGGTDYLGALFDVRIWS
jgi:hypothetical protein